MKAVLPISIGVFTVLLASACAGSPPRSTPQAGLPDHPGDGTAHAANVDRSQADVDKDMRKRGYKPATYRGERVYCRNQPLTGSNLESTVCLTARQIEEQERSGKDILNGNRPAGCSSIKNGCN
jgi:hypothetical protein